LIDGLTEAERNLHTGGDIDQSVWAFKGTLHSKMLWGLHCLIKKWPEVLNWEATTGEKMEPGDNSRSLIPTGPPSPQILTSHPGKTVIRTE
jgi:hypothetical protein